MSPRFAAAYQREAARAFTIGQMYAEANQSGKLNRAVAEWQQYAAEDAATARKLMGLE